MLDSSKMAGLCFDRYLLYQLHLIAYWQCIFWTYLGKVRKWWILKF